MAPNGSSALMNSSETQYHIADDTSYAILEQEMGSKSPIRVVCIGAGASGINLAKSISDLSDPTISLTIYEKNPEVGGTWYENRYPGCACDIPSVNYQFTWEPNPSWTSYYSGAPEILAYLKGIVQKYDLMRFIKLGTPVVHAEWDENEGLWHIKTCTPDGLEKSETAHLLINGTGILNKWKWPNVPGLQDFKGILAHSANYDTSIDLNGKRVFVIGAGSSGIQIVSTIVPIVSKLYTIVRSPTWITPGFAQRFAGQDGGNFKYSESQHALFRENPQFYLRYRKMIESELNQRFKFIIKGSEEAKQAVDFSVDQMTTKLGGDPRLVDRIIPKDFAVGCRRPTPGYGYLEALTSPKTTVFTTDLLRITPTGFIVSREDGQPGDGEELQCDAIICATGFDVSFQSRFPILARGHDLRKKESETPDSYLALAMPDIPNYLTYLGPHGPLGHGSILPIVESLTTYFLEIINKLQSENIKSLAPTREATADFKEHREEFLKRTAWTSPCKSWFKGGTIEGQPMMYPGSRLHYLEAIRHPRYEDFEIKYGKNQNDSRSKGKRGNRFEFFGNGFCTREYDSRDLTWYMGYDAESGVEGVDVQPNFESFVEEFAKRGLLLHEGK